MGAPTGAMERRAIRIREVAELIRNGEDMSVAQIKKMYGISETSARKTFNLALRFLGGEPIVPQVTGADCITQIKARRRVLPKRIEYAQGFRFLLLEYETMWGKDWGTISERVDISGKFVDGKLPADVCSEIAHRIEGKAEALWGDFINDLSAERVMSDLYIKGVAQTDEERKAIENKNKPLYETIWR